MRPAGRTLAMSALYQPLMFQKYNQMILLLF
jgi:hypothetical protein